MTEHPLKELCKEQKAKTLLVEAEQRRMLRRLQREKVVQILTLTVYAFNCSEHDVDGAVHLDFVAGSGRSDIPGSLQLSIDAAEQLLAHLKARLQ